MKNKIFSVNIIIPGNDDNFISFERNSSLSDADIILFNPSSSFTSNNPYWLEEIYHVLDFGKTVFVILSHLYTEKQYSFLPDLSVEIIATNKIQVFPKTKLVEPLQNTLQNFWKTECYLETHDNINVLFGSKNDDRILGALFEISQGHLILLPNIDFPNSESVDVNSNWTHESLLVGKKIIQNLSDIHNFLNAKEEITERPEWTGYSEFELRETIKLSNTISKNKIIVETLISENNKLLEKVEEIDILKNLLFETGKPLERGVIKALKILGYSAENYDDGVLELDQIIISPEGERFIGECEGKDNKAIDITKFRQLHDSLKEDFHREEVNEMAYGILFGNPQRLLDPNERTLDFTEKCKSGAKRELIALVNTVDLFKVARYLSENEDEEFKVKCRNAIKEQLGKLVEFPEISSV
jgi:hypothetical protein